MTAAGIKVLIPADDEIEIVNRIIYEELCLGIIVSQSKREYLRIISLIKERVVQGVILGDTEIGLLIQQKDCEIPVFDTTQIQGNKIQPFHSGNKKIRGEKNMNRFESNTSNLGTMATKSNPFLGVVGAIVGALLGAVLWVILYQIGIIASIAGIAIVFCACKGYILLSKSNTLGGMVTATSISVVVVLLTVFLCWGMDIYSELIVDYEITFLESLMLVPEVAFYPENIVEFVKEVLIGLILIGVGSAPFLRQAARNGKGNED